MKRYDCIQFADVCEMRESEYGDYILHTEHAEAMAAAEARHAATERDSCMWAERAQAAEQLASDKGEVIVSLARRLELLRGALNTIALCPANEKFNPASYAHQFLRDDEYATFGGDE